MRGVHGVAQAYPVGGCSLGPAAAFIGWIRIARPGSILGPQQHYLIEKEAKYLGEYAYINGVGNKMNLEMSPEDKRRSLYGEYN